jgi:hypothetical protein
MNFKGTLIYLFLKGGSISECNIYNILESNLTFTMKVSKCKKHFEETQVYENKNAC